ncbi:SGNH/GDSL hydrolase family protein [Paenarthrobacter sp. Z7-10]|nr:SGNH/GDSL hydrolase family protein [Paenarthrobacter sp. Z7-10]
MAVAPARVLRAAAAVLGAAAGATVAVSAITVVEGLWARRKLTIAYAVQEAPEPVLFGGEHDGDALELALLGDSLAVGVGAGSPERTIGYHVAEGLADASHRPVRLHNVAAIGSESHDLPLQLQELAHRVPRPSVAVIVIGGNDVMHPQSIAAAAQHLSHAVQDLRRTGCQVVVATCPDMGTVRPFFQPLRFFAHWLSRLLATTQTIVVLRHGGRTVSLADTVGPLFRRNPKVMFSTDSMHPSAMGYARAADVLLPSVCAAAGYSGAGGPAVPHRVYRKGGRHPLAWFAFRASREGGTALSTGKDRRRVGTFRHTRFWAKWPWPQDHIPAGLDGK